MVVESDRVDPRVVVDAQLHEDDALLDAAAHVPTLADVHSQVVVVGVVRPLAVLAVVVDRDALDLGRGGHGAVPSVSGTVRHVSDTRLD